MATKIELRDKVKWIKITELDFFEYKHSFDDDEPWKKAVLTSGTFSSSSSDAVADIPVLPSSFRQIKAAKVADIKKQIQFIPSIYRGYYESVIKNVDSCNDEDVEVNESEDSASEVCACRVWHSFPFNGLL
jgi:hypothetical protein